MSVYKGSSKKDVRTREGGLAKADTCGRGEGGEANADVRKNQVEENFYGSSRLFLDKCTYQSYFTDNLKIKITQIAEYFTE